MIREEFSTQFDIAYNNITSNQAPGLNEYEKSVFLTNAQSQLIEYYFGGFDSNQKRQYDFSSIIKTQNLKSSDYPVQDKLDPRSTVYIFPSDYYLSVNENITSNAGKNHYSVMPIDYTEYQRLMMKPYNFPPKRGAWRVFTGEKSGMYASEKNWSIDTTYVQDDSIKLTVSLTDWDDDYAQDPYYSDFNITYNEDSIIMKYPDSDVYLYIGLGSSDTSMDLYVVKGKYGDSAVGQVFESDEEIVKDIKECFSVLYSAVQSYGWIEGTEHANIAQAYKWFDCFIHLSTQNTKTLTVTETGKSITLHKKTSPVAEVIGKFSGSMQYQLRYVKTLNPIILEDLTNYGSDITIDGQTQVTECELPKETHRELLDRAVALAKIAWQGGVAQAQN